MKKYLSSVFAVLAFLFRIIIVLYDYETNEFVFHMYYPNLLKVGNDYYLSSLTTLVYLISFLILLLSIKKTRFRIVSVITLLIAAVMEVSMFFVFLKMNVYLDYTLNSGLVTLVGSAIVLVGYILLLYGKKYGVLRFFSVLAFVLCLAFGVWTVYTQLSENMSCILSLMLAFLSHFAWSMTINLGTKPLKKGDFEDNTGDGTMCSVEE